MPKCASNQLIKRLAYNNCIYGFPRYVVNLHFRKSTKISVHLAGLFGTLALVFFVEVQTFDETQQRKMASLS